MPGRVAAFSLPAPAPHQMLQQRVAQHLQLGRLVQLEQLGGNRRACVHLPGLELRRRRGAGGGRGNLERMAMRDPPIGDSIPGGRQRRHTCSCSCRPARRCCCVAASCWDASSVCTML